MGWDVRGESDELAAFSPCSEPPPSPPSVIVILSAVTSDAPSSRLAVMGEAISRVAL